MTLGDIDEKDIESDVRTQDRRLKRDSVYMTRGPGSYSIITLGHALQDGSRSKL